MMSQANSDGVFQYESPGMKRVLLQLRPDRFEDLVAVTALFRPGPMDSIRNISITVTIRKRCGISTRPWSRF